MLNLLLLILEIVIIAGIAGVIFLLFKLVRMASEQKKIKETFATQIAQSFKTAAPGEKMTQDFDRLNLQIDHINKMLQEIAENTLLDEPGRRHKKEQLAQRDREQSLAEIDRLVSGREWAQSKVLLEGLMQKYPENADLQQRLERIEQMRKQTFNEELSQTRKAISDFIAISAWDKAIRQSEILLEKHPDMAAAKELVMHVRAERNKFREDQIKRMYADIQRSIGKKRWNDALQIAKQLTEKYPDSVEAESLRSQMATLETNAEIEKRQELEQQIKDLVRRRNFIQAVELSKYVIQHYPTSPQAAALREQLPKLEEFSKSQEKEIQT